MATNYTTKTASLKATQADIRKVEATKLMVSPDGKSSSEKKDVLELISDAQKAAAISVGRDADTSWSVTEDEVTTGVKKINFMGAYVNVVPCKNCNTMDKKIRNRYKDIKSRIARYDTFARMVSKSKSVILLIWWEDFCYRSC